MYVSIFLGGVLRIEVYRCSIKTFREIPLPNVRKIVWRYFFGYGVMLEDFLNGGWPGRYRVENVSVKKMFKVFSFGYMFFFC